MPKKSSHLHRFKKVTLGKKFVVFKCQLPDCTTYYRIELVEGKLCECNRCGKPMVMTKIAMTLTKPHCPDCTRGVSDPESDALTELFME